MNDNNLSEMDSQVQRLVDQTWKKFQDFDESRRFLIAIAGIPGSGKTTTAASVAHGLNTVHQNEWHQKYPNAPRNGHRGSDPNHPDIACVVSLDGYHLTRKQLSEMSNPEEAAFRRGAAFTFDAGAYYKLVLKLRQAIEATTRTIYAPSFDHATKDPVADEVHVPPTARIVVIEGLYTALDRDDWRDAAEMMDELWFVEVELETATERVAKRNFAAGLSPTYEAALKRTIANDMRNAREILAERLPIHETIRSVNDERWKSNELKQAEEDSRVHEPIRKKIDRMNSLVELAETGAGC